MSADGRKPPPYTANTVPLTGTNPYHAGYDQPVGGNRGFYMPVPQQGQPTVVSSGVTTGGTTSSNTTVVVTSQPQASFVVAPARGSDLTLPAVLVCFFCCWITGIPAIIYASQAQNLYGTGAYQEAESSQRKARGWIIGSVVSHFVIWAIFLVLYFAVFTAAANETKNFNNYGN